MNRKWCGYCRNLTGNAHNSVCCFNYSCVNYQLRNYSKWFEFELTWHPTVPKDHLSVEYNMNAWMHEYVFLWRFLVLLVRDLPTTWFGSRDGPQFTSICHLNKSINFWFFTSWSSFNFFFSIFFSCNFLFVCLFMSYLINVFMLQMIDQPLLWLISSHFPYISYII